MKTVMDIQKGFTLIELMIVVAVLAIIATIAVPGMGNLLESNKLRGATNQFYADTQFARSESITRNNSISISVTSNGSTTWCYGISSSASCDCTITDPTAVGACAITQSGTKVLKVGQSSEFDGVLLTSPTGSSQTVTTFDPVRGIATTSGAVILQSANNLETHVDITPLGKISTCSPAGGQNVTGFSAC